MMSLVTIKGRSEELFSPPTLEEICIQLCVTNAKALLLTQPSPLQPPSSSTADLMKKQKLRKMAVNLPRDIWEQLVKRFDAESSEDYVSLVHVVHQKVPTLRKIHVRNCIQLKDEELCLIMANFPVSLDIHNCPSLTKKTLDTINKFGRNLECLSIGNSTQILPVNIDDWALHLKEAEEEGVRKYAKTISRFFKGTFGSRNMPAGERKGLLTTKNLRKLVIWGLHITQMQSVRLRLMSASASGTSASSISTGSSTNTDIADINEGGGGAGEGDSSVAMSSSELPNKANVDYWEYLTRDFIGNLEHLDLSSCHEILDFTFLLNAKESLRSLHLHDVLLDYDPNTWGTLRHFTKLRFLDVSQYNELASVFPNPDVILDELVTSLPNLVGLDIAGTNLAGFGPERSNKSCCSIIGLSSRFPHRPLQFVGLLGTHHYTTSRSNIPALQVAGGDTMDQLLCSIKVYMHRDSILRKAIRMLHEKIQENNFTDFVPCYTILDLLLQAMSYHLEDKHTVIVSLAASFHVLKRIVSGATGVPQHVCKLRMEKTFQSVVRGMEVHSQDLSILRNGVLNMLVLVSQLKKNFLYAKNEKLFPVLLKTGIVASSVHGAANTNPEIFLIKAVIHLLHTFTFFEKKQVLETACDSEIIDQMCVFLDQLFNNTFMQVELRTLWTILLKWISEPIKTGSNKQDSNFYNRLTCTRIVDICFKLVEVYNDADEISEPPRGMVDVQSLQEILKPVLAFLANTLYNNTTSAAEEQIVKPKRVQQLLRILEKSGTRDDNVLHACCGLLARIASRKALDELVESSVRQEIGNKIFKTMMQMNRSNKFLFTFRKLDQLYDLVSAHNAPEIQYWGLWTLLKLTEADDKFVKMIVEDGKLILNDNVHKRPPGQHTTENDEDDDSTCNLEVQKLWGCLSKIISNNVGLTDYKRKTNK